MKFKGELRGANPRENWVGPTYGIPVLMPERRAAKLVWKNRCAAGNPSLYKFSDEVFEHHFDRREV